MGGGDSTWLPERVSRRKRKITPPEIFYGDIPVYESDDNEQKQ